MSHYSSELEHEGPFETDSKLTAWPSSGKIDFVNVNVSDGYSYSIRNWTIRK